MEGLLMNVLIVATIIGILLFICFESTIEKFIRSFRPRHVEYYSERTGHVHVVEKRTWFFKKVWLDPVTEKWHFTIRECSMDYIGKLPKKNNKKKDKLKAIIYYNNEYDV